MKKIKAVEDKARSEGSETLQDGGINDQRWNFIAGLTNSVDEFRRHKPAKTAKDLLIRYFELLRETGISKRTDATAIPYSPDNLTRSPNKPATP